MVKCYNPNCNKEATVQCFVPCAGAISDIVYYCEACARDFGYCTFCGYSKYDKRVNNNCLVCGPMKLETLSIVDNFILRQN